MNLDALAVGDDAVLAAERAHAETAARHPGVGGYAMREALIAALPYLRFSPTGDNHHNAAACPYCSPREAP